ncbi:CP123L [African swine fever virus]|uniref:CP123L n=1 Tax=African swine fever virus TaxID=10497 RepID=A0A7S5QE07_ASF|nr:CP123L [African swine fever virus]
MPSTGTLVIIFAIVLILCIMLLFFYKTVEAGKSGVLPPPIPPPTPPPKKKYDHNEYMEKTDLEPEVKKNHKKWANEAEHLISSSVKGLENLDETAFLANHKGHGFRTFDHAKSLFKEFLKKY